MTAFEPLDPEFESRIRASFNLQPIMVMLGAFVTEVKAGQATIRLPYRADLTQQHGFLHAGIVTTIVDNACGYAAYTLMPANVGVLTVEFKVNFMSPAKGDYFIATGQVLKSGRTITVCEGRVVAYTEDSEKLIAAMQATMIQVNT